MAEKYQNLDANNLEIPLFIFLIFAIHYLIHRIFLQIFLFHTINKRPEKQTL